MRIRPAESLDLLQIVDVFWQCWTHTYASSSTLRAAMAPDRAAALWAANLADPDSTVLVAESEGVGAAGGVLGVVRYVQEDAGQGYVGSLYVAPDAHGRGVGRELLTAAERALAAAGAKDARLWVFAINTGAQEFYRRAGWRRDGETRTRDMFGEPELGMTKALPGSTPSGGRTTHESEQDDEPPLEKPAARSTSDGTAGGTGARRGAGDRHARSG